MNRCLLGVLTADVDLVVVVVLIVCVAVFDLPRGGIVVSIEYLLIWHLLVVADSGRVSAAT